MRLFDAIHSGQTPGPDPAVAAVKSYRYLRLAMIGMVIGLAVSVVVEAVRVGDCLQTSISGYYYTPVQNFFVGALVTIGVCLVALKGNTDVEDVLLNLAGICAPFVAFVPTPDPGDCGTLTDTVNRDLNVDNNVVALLVVIGLMLAAVPVFVRRDRRKRPEDELPTPIDVLGYAESVLLFVAVTATFFAQPRWFTDHGHQVAAVTMFVLVLAVVLVNAVNLYFERRRSDAVPWHNRYTWIAAAMLLAAGISIGLAAGGFGHWVLTIEASLITCFAVFWGVQTWELWDKGLREHRVDADGADATPTPAGV